MMSFVSCGLNATRRRIFLHCSKSNIFQFPGISHSDALGVSIKQQQEQIQDSQNNHGSDLLDVIAHDLHLEKSNILLLGTTGSGAMKALGLLHCKTTSKTFARQCRTLSRRSGKSSRQRVSLFQAQSGYDKTVNIVKPELLISKNQMFEEQLKQLQSRVSVLEFKMMKLEMGEYIKVVINLVVKKICPTRINQQKTSFIFHQIMNMEKSSSAIKFTDNEKIQYKLFSDSLENEGFTIGQFYEDIKYILNLRNREAHPKLQNLKDVAEKCLLSSS